MSLCKEWGISVSLTGKGSVNLACMSLIQLFSTSGVLLKMCSAAATRKSRKWSLRRNHAWESKGWIITWLYKNDFPYHPSLLAFFLVVAGECKLIVGRSYEVPAVVLFAAHSWRRADGHCRILEQDQIKCMEGSDQSMKVHWYSEVFLLDMTYSYRHFF